MRRYRIWDDGGTAPEDCLEAPLEDWMLYHDLTDEEAAAWEKHLEEARIWDERWRAWKQAAERRKS